MSRTEEEHQSLWLLTVSPMIWAAHFLLCYVTSAIWCAKLAGPDASLGPMRGAVAAYTLVALGGIAITARIGYRKHSLDASSPPHDADTPEDRHRFLGLATLLVSVLCAVSVTFAATVALFFRTCH